MHPRELEARGSQQFDALTASGLVAYDADGAGRCIDAYRALVPTCNDSGINDAIDESCLGVFTGTVALGGACATGTDCARVQGRSVSCSDGRCLVETELLENPVGLGEPCNGSCVGEVESDSRCNAVVGGTGEGSCWESGALYCSSVSGVCEQGAAEGEACAEGSGCAQGSYCWARVCTALTRDGPCAYTSQCVDTSYCSSDTLSCQSRRAEAMACSRDQECLGGQCYEGACRIWTVALPETCEGRVIEF